MALLSLSIFVWNRNASWFVEFCLDDFERSSSLSVSVVFLLLRYCLMPEVLCFFESILNNNSSLI